MDGYFQGVPKEEFDNALERFPRDGLKVLSSPEDAIGIDKPYITEQCITHSDILIPDHLFGKSNLPAPEEMEGEYDIIYYGGEASQFLSQHYRTACGTVKISNSSGGRGEKITEGTVTMHPCMEDIDVIPFGGNYSFKEVARVQRGGTHLLGNYYPGNTTTSTGVIKVEVTDPPDGLCKNDVSSRFQKDHVLDGELRIFREKVGAGITDQEPLDTWTERDAATIVTFNATEEAEALNRAHYEKTCSWLHKHTILDEASARHIGEFTCPPPVLFFMEGDIQIDINWKRIAPCCCMTNSCIIAR